jgi:hypothetical protein
MANNHIRTSKAKLIAGHLKRRPRDLRHPDGNGGH